MAGKREAPQPSRGHRGDHRYDGHSRSRAQNAYFEEDRPRSRRSSYDEEYYRRDDRRRSPSSSSGHRPPHDPPRGGNERKRKKKRMPIWQKVIIIVLVVIILLMITAVAAVWMKLNGIDRIKIGEEVQTSEDFEQDDPEAENTIDSDSITFSDQDKVHADEDVINILLIGRDSRNADSERGRSDSMIVLSLNRKNQQISMVSLMRDCYVQIPGYSNNKLNSAFAFGGYELMDKTISQNFGIEIDYNVGVNFDGFEQVVDKLGGIDITLTANEAEYMALWGYPDMVEGVNHMDGEQALCYARTRYVGTGKEANDFGRTYRQRVVMTTVYEEMMKKSLLEIWSILDSVMDCVETDMTNAEIISIGTEFYNMGIDNLQSYRLPQDGEYTDEKIDGMSVLVLDWDAAQQNLQEWLYSDTPAAEHGVDAAN